MSYHELDPEARNLFRAAVSRLTELYSEAVSTYVKAEEAQRMGAPDFRVRLMNLCLTIEGLQKDMDEAVPPPEPHEGVRRLMRDELTPKEQERIDKIRGVTEEFSRRMLWE